MNEQGKRENPTVEKMKRYNRKRAVAKFTELVKERFLKGALFVTLKYDRQRLTKDRATRDLQNYMRRLKYRCKINYLAIPDYIAVTVPGKRAHHHLIILAAAEEVKQAGWNEGKLLIEKFYPELIEHLIKDMNDDIFKKWSSSKSTH